MKKILLINLFLISLIVFISCNKEKNANLKALSYDLSATVLDYNVSIPEHFNNNFFGPFGSNRQIEINKHLANLGRVLFYEPKMSINNTVACASCHNQAIGFADDKKFSQGFESMVTIRNSPSIANMAFESGFFWDGRESNLNSMVLKPISNHIEMGIVDMNDMPLKLSKISYYPVLFERAFGSTDINNERIADAISTFLQSMVSLNSKWDIGHEMDFRNFSAQEQLGKDIFFGEGKCSNCHNLDKSGWTQEFANIGLDEEYTDQGMANSPNNKLSGNNTESLKGMFKVPNLRNVELTAPYMHDGRFTSLEEVINHYNSGIKNHPNLDWSLSELDQTTFERKGPIKMNLSEDKKQALIAFLKTLTDYKYLSDKKFSNPFN